MEKNTALVVLVFFSDEYFWLVVPGAQTEVFFEEMYIFVCTLTEPHNI